MDAQVEALLKDQVNKEFYSAYLYLAFSNYYHGENLDGFGHWFEAQAREEQERSRAIRSRCGSTRGIFRCLTHRPNAICAVPSGRRMRNEKMV